MKDIAAFLTRVFIGGMFIYLGWTKALDPVTFLKSIREFDILQTPWKMNVVAAWLPWFEVWCGSLLMLGVGVRASAFSLGALLVAFTSMVLWRALNLYSAGGIAFCEIQFDCGCGNGEVIVCHKIVQNVALILFSFWIACIKNHKFGLLPAIRFSFRSER